MKSIPLTDTTNSFSALLDRYIHQVADKCDLVVTTKSDELINKVDLSALTMVEQKEFENWLISSFYVRIGVENALRRGVPVKALLARTTTTRAIYSVHIEGSHK